MSVQKRSVLIVGAGPTGLMAACQLARFGIDFKIIDAKDGPTTESRALIVQARTLEIYDQLGLAGHALDKGYIATGMNFHTGGKHRARVPLGDIGQGLSPFPYLLVLEQCHNEEILLEHLKTSDTTVGWNTSFAGLEQTAGGVSVSTITADGQEATIDADWVIAADGASSPIRHALNMRFEGGTYSERFYVADLVIDGDILHTEGSIFLAEKGFALILPMDGERRFRLVGIVPHSVTTDTPTFADIEKDLEPIFQRSLTFHEPNWFSSYTVHHRCVDSFQSGRVLFAGDAAHIHSPAGGQGMNTGLLDAHNLAWKLALVCQGMAKDDLVKTYSEERLPFAHRLLDTTDRVFQAAMSQKSWLVFLRTKLFPRLVRTAMRLSFARRRFFETISQIGITHRSRALSVDHGTEHDMLRAGDRLPVFQIEANRKEQSTLDLLKTPGLHLIDFSAPAKAEHNARMLKNLSATLPIPVQYTEAICLDDQWRRDVEGHTYLVRPDMYVGLASADLNESQLRDYLENVLGIAG